MNEAKAFFKCFAVFILSQVSTMEDSQLAQAEEQTPKIGIFVCECGGNIGDVVDVKAVIDSVKTWPGVAIARYNKYLCSRPAQEIIIEDIKKKS